MTGLLLVVIFGIVIAFGLYKAFWNFPVERIIAHFVSSDKRK